MPFASLDEASKAAPFTSIIHYFYLNSTVIQLSMRNLQLTTEQEKSII